MYTFMYQTICIHRYQRMTIPHTHKKKPHSRTCTHTDILTYTRKQFACVYILNHKLFSTHVGAPIYTERERERHTKTHKLFSTHDEAPANVYTHTHTHRHIHDNNQLLFDSLGSTYIDTPIHTRAHTHTQTHTRRHVFVHIKIQRARTCLCANIS